MESSVRRRAVSGVGEMRVAVVLTTYNRPKLVGDAIASVLEQTEPCRLYIMDDGSNDESRSAIRDAIGARVYLVLTGDRLLDETKWGDIQIFWWQGPRRSVEEREQMQVLPYAVTINYALNFLISEPFVTFLCDDDYLYPDSTRVRADYLFMNRSHVHVAYGRSRSVEYGQGEYNRWRAPGAPRAGRTYPVPTGDRIIGDEHHGGRHYFSDGESDPETGLSYVEEGHWQPGGEVYGAHGSPDHNQVMHRAECLSRCGIHWTGGQATLGGTAYWPERPVGSCADVMFFERLGSVHRFHSVDAWVVTKRYHAYGVHSAEVRE